MGKQYMNEMVTLNTESGKDGAVVGDIRASSYPLLSPDLVQYYTNNGLDGMETFLKSKVHVNGPCTFSLRTRFIRLNPRYDSVETLKLLKDELPDNESPTEVTWLGSKMGFYSIPSHFSLHQSISFTSGRIYGMDVSSGAAVAALLFNEFDRHRRELLGTRTVHDKPLRVLDLCCAPGLKLCAMADLLQLTSFHSTHDGEGGMVELIGVDVCPQRISLCKNILCKYHIHSDTRGNLSESTKGNINIKLFCTDGTTLGDTCFALNPSTLVFDSNVAFDESSHAGKRRRMNKSARMRERKHLQRVFTSEKLTVDSKECTSSPLTHKQLKDAQLVNPWLNSFDYILVDAECSTDGAIYHMTRKIQSIHDSQSMLSNDKLTNPNQLCHLIQLQRNLIHSGFQLLRPGGILVYSTCSLSTEQNEGIVTWLIKQFPITAFIIPLHFHQADENRVNDGELPGTIRFRPNINNAVEGDAYGGGFFIAKIGKK